MGLAPYLLVKDTNDGPLVIQMDSLELTAAALLCAKCPNNTPTEEQPVGAEVCDKMCLGCDKHPTTVNKLRKREVSLLAKDRGFSLYRLLIFDEIPDTTKRKNK